jgi:general stress protein 26
MKTETQRGAELSQLRALIADFDVAMLTNLDDEGALVSRPMAPLEMDGEGALWFFTDWRLVKVDQLGIVNLSFTDPQRAVFVSLSGRGEFHTDRSRIDRLWTEFARPWFPQGPDSSNLALLKFVPDTAAYWDAPHSPTVRMFAMAASMVAGKPIAQGEHDTLTALSNRNPTTALR